MIPSADDADKTFSSVWTRQFLHLGGLYYLIRTLLEIDVTSMVCATLNKTCLHTLLRIVMHLLEMNEATGEERRSDLVIKAIDMYAGLVSVLRPPSPVTMENLPPPPPPPNNKSRFTIMGNNQAGAGDNDSVDSADGEGSKDGSEVTEADLQDAELIEGIFNLMFLGGLNSDLAPFLAHPSLPDTVVTSLLKVQNKTVRARVSLCLGKIADAGVVANHLLPHFISVLDAIYTFGDCSADYFSSFISFAKSSTNEENLSSVRTTAV